MQINDWMIECTSKKFMQLSILQVWPNFYLLLRETVLNSTKSKILSEIDKLLEITEIDGPTVYSSYLYDMYLTYYLDVNRDEELETKWRIFRKETILPKELENFKENKAKVVSETEKDTTALKEYIKKCKKDSQFETMTIDISQDVEEVGIFNDIVSILNTTPLRFDKLFCAIWKSGLEEIWELGEIPFQLEELSTITQGN